MTACRPPDHADRGRRTSTACPHCGAATRTRTSRRSTALVRDSQIYCIDATCGATYASQTVIVHQISPSARPNPAVHLRLAPPRRRADNDSYPLPANDTQADRGPGVPQPANDEDAPAVATG